MDTVGFSHLWLLLISTLRNNFVSYTGSINQYYLFHHCLIKNKNTDTPDVVRANLYITTWIRVIISYYQRF
jgi:hypothetical protein